MKGQILALFHFFLKFGLACRKIEASQGFWYQGVGADMLFRNSQSPIWITVDSLLLPIFSKFSGRPSPEIRTSMESSIFLGSSLKGLSTM